MAKDRWGNRYQSLLTQGLPKPLVTSFAPKGRSHWALYVVSVRDQPGVVKIGMTTRWSMRRHEYACWNLADGDGISAERVFVITEEFCDLPELERYVLESVPYPQRHGKEWFCADFDEAAREVDRLLDSCGLSYTLLDGL